MLYTILGIIAGIMVLFLILVALRPAEFRIERQATMQAPPSAVFAQVNDFRNWAAWSPWEKFDPAMKKTFEGPSSGVGAVYAWDGNSRVGAGRNTIVESRPNELVGIKLEFQRPFKATNMAEFTFKPAGDQTVVTWSMTGRNNFMMKAFGLFMSMDKMVGSQFEEGLASLKSVVERAPARA